GALGWRPDSLLVRTRIPSEHPLRFRVGRVLALSQLRYDLLHLRIAQRGESHEPVWHLTLRHLPCGLSEASSQHLRDLQHRDEVPGDREETLALRRRVRHRAKV